MRYVLLFILAIVSFVLDASAGIDACPEYEPCVQACVSQFPIAAADPPDSPMRVGRFNCDNTCYSLHHNCDLTQTTAQQASAQLSGQASAQAAAVGVVTIAEGANVLLENESNGGVLIGAGIESMDAADKLKQAELAARKNIGDRPGNSELTANNATIDSSKARAIFEDLERLYGLKREEFTSKVVESKGDRDVLADLLKGKFSKEHLFKAIDDASGISQEEKKQILTESRASGLSEENTYQLGTSLAMKRTGAASTSLRDSLKEKLEREVASEDAPEEEGKSSTPDQRKMFGKETLQPATEFFSLSAEESGEEGTLFDVVHRKYEEKLLMMNSR